MSIYRSREGAVIRPLREVVRELVIEALVHTYGNKQETAVLLGITTRTVENKMREYGISLEQVRHMRAQRLRQQQLFSTKTFRIK